MSAVAPMFPLPGFFLFPHALVPLHVFEPRYRQMIDDLLDGPGRLVMATILQTHLHEIAGAPPVFEVAGLGEIVQHRRLADGRFMILLLGLGRVTIEEIDSDRLYRRACYTLLPEPAASEPEDARLRVALRDAIAARAKPTLELPEDLDASRLADVLLQCLQLPGERLQELFATVDPVRRAEAALREHVERT